MESFGWKQMNITSSEGYLIINRPFINRVDFIKVIKAVDNKVDVFERIILALMKAPNRRLYTYDNIFITFDHQIRLNEASFAGVLSLAHKEDF